MNTLVPIVGQIASIAVQAAAASFMFYLMGEMKYTFYFSIVNGLRYFYYKDRILFLIRLLAIFTTLFILSCLQQFNVFNVIMAFILVVIGLWALQLHLSSNKRVVPSEELREYYEPWHWLKSNPVYTWYAVKGWSTVIIVFGLLHQLALNQVYTKPREFFIGSPLSGLSFIFVVLNMATIIKRQASEISFLKAAHKAKH